MNIHEEAALDSRRKRDANQKGKCSRRGFLMGRLKVRRMELMSEAIFGEKVIKNKLDLEENRMKKKKRMR